MGIAQANTTFWQAYRKVVCWGQSSFPCILMICPVPQLTTVRWVFTLMIQSFTAAQKVTKLIVKHLNNSLANIYEWCTKWRIKINAGKLEAILICKKSKHTSNLEPPEFSNIPLQ